MADYIIIGNGVTGTIAAEHIRKFDEKGKITVFTEEDLPFYNRVRLNDFITGETMAEGLVLKNDEWYRERKIQLFTNIKITGADPANKAVIAADGRVFTYHRLLLATGSRSFVPAIPGATRAGVFTLRDIKDARAIKQYAKNVKEVVLIGGGLLGLETGNALIKLGKKVRVVEFFPRLLPRQLDGEGGGRLQRIMEKMGFAFHLGAVTKEIGGNGTVTRVALESGDELPTPMVIISAGVRPNMDLAAPLALETDKGIKVDSYLRTSRPDVYAAGDVAAFGGPPYGIWPAGFQQGKIAGANMAGANLEYTGTSFTTKLKVAGIELAAAGNIDADNAMRSVVRQNEQIYKKVVLDSGRIVGFILLGDTAELNALSRYMTTGEDVSALQEQLISVS